MSKGKKGSKGKKDKKSSEPAAYVSKGARGGTFFTPTHEMMLSMSGPSIPTLSMSGPGPKSPTSSTSTTEPKVKNIRKNKGKSQEPARPLITAANQTGLLHQALLSTSSPHLRTLTRFKKNHGILLVGEGDFSFASALCRALEITPQSSKGDGRIIATSYDTISDISTKYTTEAVDRIRLLQRLPNVSVIHKLDATEMSSDNRLVSADSLDSFKPLHRIVFNFPHVGGGMDKDVKINRRMLFKFFTQSQILLSLSYENSGSNANMEDFKVFVSLRKTPFYEKFGIQELAEANGFKLTERARFDGERWSALGYRPQRTNPAQREAPGWENAELFVFSLDSEQGFEPEEIEELEESEPEEEEEEEVDRKKGRKERREDREKRERALVKKGSRAYRVQEKFKRRQEKKDAKKQKLGKVKGGKIAKGGGKWESL
ncbi:hypothetical protein HDU79_007025 [Rhizoclosmatium sp. JEL0117]|nr:hypothetical protein HDU79_007025 [Rhizoclosmatium sp. JEL0117]